MHKIKTALCSFGMSGKIFHAPFIECNQGFELYAVLERSNKSAVEIYPNIISYSTLDDLLKDDSIELVIVNTPNSTHYEFAKKCLVAGKHVVVEKPFTVSTAEANDLISIAKTLNKKLSVYHNRRWDSDFKTVLNVIKSGMLGNIVEAEIHFDRFSNTLSYKKHKELAAAGNGVQYDLGSHLIDAALYLFGYPMSVFGDLRILRPGSKVDDYMDILLYYPGLRVRLKSSYITMEAIPGFIIHGYHGSLLKSRADVQEKHLMEGRKPDDDNWGSEPESEQGILHSINNGVVGRRKIITASGNYMEYYDQLYIAIRDNGPLPVTAEEGLNVIRIIEAAIESCNSKSVVHLNSYE